jgi:septal ring factor EnvC (AmiA/AmiB activator)
MKECTGLWIVAPITRAVDDKTAKELLGDSFKRQLMYDGTYSAVTFICSKTDDISITEVADSLRLDQVFTEDWKKMDELDSALQAHARRFQELQDQETALTESLDQVETEFEQ